jgi:bacterioferritin
VDPSFSASPRNPWATCGFEGALSDAGWKPALRADADTPPLLLATDRRICGPSLHLSRHSNRCVGPKLMKNNPPITREEMIRLLNEDLAREYQAIIAYVVYSQTMKGAKYQHIAGELEKHAGEELAHAIIIAKQIDYFNGTPVTAPKDVKMSENPDDLLRFDLENERVTILAYRERIQQAEAMGEFALSEALREIIMQEQEHLTDLADALGIDNPRLDQPK